MRFVPSRAWLSGAVGAGVAVAAALGSGLPARVELPLRDALMRTLPRRPAVHVAAIEIDEAALAGGGPWPWPREELASVVAAARRAGARALALDILLLEPRPGDGALAEALTGMPTVLVAAPNDDASAWLRPIPVLASPSRIAHGVFELDHDGVLRRIVTTKQAGGTALPALAIEAAVMASPHAAVPIGRPLEPGFRTAPAAVPRVSAARLLRGEGTVDLTGRIVFVGVTAAGLGDRVVTPVTRGPRPDPGVLVHAAVTEAILAGDLVHPASPLLAGLAAVVLVAAVGVVSRLGGGTRLAGAALLLGTPLIASIVSLHAAALVLPTATLVTVVASAILALEVRLGLIAWRRTGTTAALLSNAPEPADSLATSPEERLDVVEELATIAARRRLAEEESRRVVAHELKTPLTSVRGLSQMLRDLDLAPDDRRRAANLLVSEADRLHAMIEQLLELERLPRRDLARTGQVVDLTALLEERAALLGRGHGRVIRTQIAASLAVRGDRALLSRVADNLIGNAFKFSPSDTVVEVDAAQLDATVVIAVRDHGCGIPREEQERVFHRFVRGAGAGDREGLGLGLALVREVITWHGGDVTVSSAPEQGSTFTLVLPAARESGVDAEDPRR